MKKLVGLPSDLRLTLLLCSSVAVLLSACGGGSSDAGNGQQAKTAAYSFSSATGTPDGSAAATGPAAASPREQLITDLYWWLLGRAPDEIGLDFWIHSGATLEVIESDFKKSAEHVKQHDWKHIVPDTVNHYYVDASVASEGDGSQQRPFKTLAAAAKVAKPSTTFWVAPGSYDGGIVTNASGSASAVQNKDGGIYWVSRDRWGARIVPPSVTIDVGIDDTAWWNTGSNVSIVGFVVDGTRSSDSKNYANWRLGIYTSGTRSVVKANHVHHIGRWTACTGMGGAGIDIDAYMQGGKADAIDNWVNDIGPSNCNQIHGIYVSSSGTIANNVVYRVSAMAIHLWHEATEVKVFNNTVAASSVGILVGAGDQHRDRDRDGKNDVTVNDYTDVHNNIVIGNGMGIREYLYPGEHLLGKHNTYKNNLLYKNGTAWDLEPDTAAPVGTVSADPQLVGYSASVLIPNFHLASGSPAIGRGLAASARPTDFDGRPRGNQDGYAIGAYEP